MSFLNPYKGLVRADFAALRLIIPLMTSPAPWKDCTPEVEQHHTASRSRH